jgi:hypothetical protein
MTADERDMTARKVSAHARTSQRWPVARPARAFTGQRQPSRCYRTARAYRAGRLICGCVHVTISLDDRLGLTQRERRLVHVRFYEPLDDALRAELAHLVHRRGAAARRVADTLDAIELAIDDPSLEPQHITGHLQPPHVRHRHPRGIEFGLRETERPR